jgi:hypothetical protein
MQLLTLQLGVDRPHLGRLEVAATVGRRISYQLSASSFPKEKSRRELHYSTLADG